LWLVGSRRVIVFLAFCTSALVSHARALEGNGKNLQDSHDVLVQYVQPLHLEGKLMHDAMNVLIADGFSCRVVRDLGDWGPNSEASSVYVDCYTDHSNFGERCHSVSVSITPLKSEMAAHAQESLSRSFGIVHVRGAGAVCLGWPRISERQYKFLLNGRDLAQSKLAAQTNLDEVRGKSAEEVQFAMLERGYACGLENVDEPNRDHATLLACIKPQTGIENCFRARIEFNVKWLNPAASRETLLKEMSHARIGKPKISCDIPDSGTIG